MDSRYEYKPVDFTPGRDPNELRADFFQWRKPRNHLQQEALKQREAEPNVAEVIGSTATFGTVARSQAVPLPENGQDFVGYRERNA